MPLDHWFKWAEKRSSPNLESSAMFWEQSLVTGHPAHPMHRSCLAEPPLQQLAPEDISSLLEPQILFLQVPAESILITGPFRSLIAPFLDLYRIPKPVDSGEIILPCLTAQIAAISKHFPRSKVLSTRHCTVLAQAQASIRTVAIPGYSYHLKLALAYKITSALRTVTPWTACVGPELSWVLQDTVASEKLWLAAEVASVTGAQSDFDAAKHISVCLRQDVEPRAAVLNQVVIICAALAERPVNKMQCHAVLAFELESEAQKSEWLESYVAHLLEAFIPPVLTHGVCFEAHGQNVMLRVDKTTGFMRGFVVRDLGGVKVHMPTLKEAGYRLTSAQNGSFVTTEDEQEAWSM